MSTFHSRGRRRRRQAATAAGFLVTPDAGHEIQLTDFAAVAELVVDAVTSGLFRFECLVLLDGDRRVVGLLCDAPAEVGLLIGRLEIPEVTPFCQLIDLVYRDDIEPGPPDDEDHRKFDALRRGLALQGILLLDVILANADVMRSLAIACDPDPVWFEPFESLEQYGSLDPRDGVDPGAEAGTVSEGDV